MLWSLAVHDYGLTSEQFWRTTPAQFQALSKRHNKEIEMRDFSFGIVASTIANCHRNPKVQKKPFTPKDFMPQYEKSKKKQQTSVDMKKYWDMVVKPEINTLNKAREKLNAKKGSRTTQR